MNAIEELLAQLSRYETSDLEEQAMQREMIDFVSNTEDCFLRTHQYGHLTASAFVLNAKRDKVLIIHHKKLDRWLQPGGHADGHPNLLEVAQKEVEEETGITTFPISKEIFDLDIHKIPARKQEPEHFHFDLRYLLGTREGVVLNGNGEVKDLKWIAIDELKTISNERSILRMAEKCNPEFLAKIE